MTTKDHGGPPLNDMTRPSLLLAGLCIAWILFYAFFNTFPRADTDFSQIFCSDPTMVAGGCTLFPARDNWLAKFFRFIFFWAPVAALVLLAADIIWRYSRDRWADGMRIKHEFLAITAYLVGPILLVNLILKAYSYRPRPIDITLFGGELSFMPVGDFSGACVSNCSFVSGEAAAAGWLLGLLPLLRGRRRHLAGVLLIIASIAASLLRVVMGAHFLSDVILGWLIGAMSVPALYLLLTSIPKGISATLDRIR